MKHFVNTSSNNKSIPTGAILKSLSPSTQYVIRLRARNAVGWSCWSEETPVNDIQNRTMNGMFNIGNRYASNRLWLSWDPSIAAVKQKDKERIHLGIDDRTNEKHKKGEIKTEEEEEEGNEIKEDKDVPPEVPRNQEKNMQKSKNELTSLTQSKKVLAKRDIRIEFQDFLSFQKRSHEWTECMKYDASVFEYNCNERKRIKNERILRQKKEKREQREKEKEKRENKRTMKTGNGTESTNSKSSQHFIPKTPFETDDDESLWHLPLVEIDQLLPGHSYRFRLIEYSIFDNNHTKHLTVLGDGPSNWIKTATDVPGPPRNVTHLNETSSTIEISFAPPHVGPSISYGIEYQLGIQNMRKDSDSSQLKRNRQNKLSPKGPWRYSGSIVASSSINVTDQSIRKDEDKDEDEEELQKSKRIEELNQLEEIENNDEEMKTLFTGDNENQHQQQHEITATPVAVESLQPSTQHKYTVKNLLSNEYYRIRIFARNQNGIGEATITSLWIKTLPTPPTPSALPPYISGKSSRSLHVQWERANGYGEIVLLYRVQMRERVSKTHDEESSDEEEADDQENHDQKNGFKRKRGTWKNVGEVAKSVDEDDGWRSLEVFDLTPGKTYEFRLAAKSQYGWGKYGPASRSCQCEFEPPEIIKDLSIELSGVKNNMVRLQWSKPHSFGKEIEFYDIEIQSKQNLNVWVSVCTTSKCSRYVGLDVITVGIPHRFRIRSVNSVGYSKFSKESNWWTLQDE